jgi:hypothetical protein
MAAIKTLGSSGQIALGRQYAGRRAIVDELEPGVWIVKVGEFVPDNERWLHQPEVKSKLDRALARAESSPLQETDLDELEERMRGGARTNPTGSERP